MGNTGFDAARWADGEVDLGAFRDKRPGSVYERCSNRWPEDWRTDPDRPSGLDQYQGYLRCLSNSSVAESEILADHFRATQSRVAAHEGPILILQDTTEFHINGAIPKGLAQSAWPPAVVMKRGDSGFIRSAFEPCGPVLAVALDDHDQSRRADRITQARADRCGNCPDRSPCGFAKESTRRQNPLRLPDPNCLARRLPCTRA